MRDTMLIKSDPSRWNVFFNIPDEQALTIPGEDKDLFVGANRWVCLTVDNGTVIQFRDIVVLGKLLIRSSDPENETTKPSIIARDVFFVGGSSLNHINMTCRWLVMCSKGEFYESLHELIFERINIQIESVRKIGLKSILCAGEVSPEKSLGLPHLDHIESASEHEGCLERLDDKVVTISEVTISEKGSNEISQRRLRVDERQSEAQLRLKRLVEGVEERRKQTKLQWAKLDAAREASEQRFKKMEQEAEEEQKKWLERNRLDKIKDMEVFGELRAVRRRKPQKSTPNDVT